jgi:hypothetical protein
MSAANKTPESPTAQRGTHCVQRLVPRMREWWDARRRRKTHEWCEKDRKESERLHYWAVRLKAEELQIEEEARALLKAQNDQAHRRRDTEAPAATETQSRRSVERLVR